MSDLTQEQKRIRIAQALGARQWDNPTNFGPRLIWSFSYVSPVQIFDRFEATEYCFLPDYFGSLDAITPAVMGLPATMRSVFLSRLADVLIEVNDGRVFDCAAANAEAFGRTLKLW